MVVIPTVTDEVEVVSEKGFTSTEVLAASGISYRQLDYWATQRWIRASIDSGTGQGSIRRYSLQDVVVIATIAELVKLGIPAQSARDVTAQTVQEDGLLRYIRGPIEVRVDIARIRTNVSTALGMGAPNDANV